MYMGENMKRRKRKNKTKIKYFRNFGDLSNDSVVTDLYKKRYKKQQKRNSISRGKKVVIRMATEEEKKKYNIEQFNKNIFENI